MPTPHIIIKHPQTERSEVRIVREEQLSSTTGTSTDTLCNTVRYVISTSTSTWYEEIKVRSINFNLFVLMAMILHV
eukprot:SAG31_NODE_1956_length_6817_cov_10.363501_1_plen_76_part_00